jgi:homoserine kinase
MTHDDSLLGTAVRVPGSSANLGPGFDGLGVALDVYLRVRVVARRQERVVVSGEGSGELSCGDDNLIWQALAAYCGWAKVAVPDVSLESACEIPLERGMGSSSAAAAAGVVLGRALTGGGGRNADLVAIAGAFDGHLDNVGAAILGGLVLCRPERVVRLDPTERLRPVLFVPPTRQSTPTARGILPESVPLPLAAANGTRLASVVVGLSGLAAWDPSAMTDVLHEPARLAAMPDSGELVGALRHAGVAACLSGAGPSVLAVVPATDDLAPLEALAPVGWTVRASRWDRTGALVTTSRDVVDIPA